jgi:group II intron reverse transcriptase/maturase
MQSLETVLNVIQNRGKQGKCLERLYRQLFSQELLEEGYTSIYPNKGALTKGSSEDTLDGMSRERISKSIQKIKTSTYRWKPVERVYIPKEDGRKRPIGIPSGDDKVLQAAMKILLEAYYEPQFSKRSHGFRPRKGCHTALQQIRESHRDTSWFIEGDIKGCFDNIDHEILLEIMGEKIKDQRFINLIKFLLKVGYMEDWVWNETLSGAPQGGIISPLLANVYLDKFDKWVEKTLLPFYNYGSLEDKGRKRNPEYRNYEYKRGLAKRKGDKEAYKMYGKLMKSVPSIIDDDSYRKLEYVRYADDFLLSFAGPRKEAEEIKELIRNFLEEELNLELSEEKTLITETRSEKARFLGYDLCVMQGKERRTANGQIWFGVPREVIQRAKKKYMRKGKVIHRPELLLNSDYDIVTRFQQEYRGLAQYYAMAHNIHRLSEVEWVTSTSLLKTLAGKHKTTVNKIVKKHKTTRMVDGRSYRVFEAKMERKDKKPLTAHFGANPLIRKPDAHIRETFGVIRTNRSELLQRLYTEECEMCGNIGRIEVHHVRGLKDLQKPGRKTKPAWVHRMAALRRITLMVCKTCHRAITNGEHRNEWDIWKNSVESRVR